MVGIGIGIGTIRILVRGTRIFKFSIPKIIENNNSRNRNWDWRNKDFGSRIEEFQIFDPQDYREQ